MKYFILIFFVFIGNTANAFAEEDIFGDYNKDVQTPADAKNYNVYEAWGDNMANLIERKERDGIVIKGAGDYANGKVHSKGIGNVEVEKNANVGVIVNKPEINKSNVFIFDNSPRSTWK